jgi:uncharacterized membrane protein YeiH
MSCSGTASSGCGTSDVIACLIVALGAWLLAYLKPGVLEGWGGRKLLIWADAAGFSLFADRHVERADAAAPVLSAVALGAMTATFGGILRDILAGDRPMLLWGRDFYVTAATAGAATTAALTGLGLSAALVMLGGFVVCFGPGGLVAVRLVIPEPASQTPD